MKNHQKSALILVDLQNDFCEGGALAVAKASEIISIANQLQPHFHLVIATQDWHPADHMSFASNHPGHKPGDVIRIRGIQQILWTDHCIQHSKGSEFHPQLDQAHFNKIVLKGVDKEIDSYSAFYDNEHLRSTGLSDYLIEHDINAIYIMGLATDYCVKYSCLDAMKLGLNIYVIADGCRGIDLRPGDVERAFEEMKRAGVNIITAKEILQQQNQLD